MSNPFIHLFVQSENPDSPVLLLLHGTGGDEHSLLSLGRELLPGAHLLSPKGNVLENGMPRFFRRIAEGVFDLEDLAFRTQELAEFINTSRERYNLKTNKVIAVGYSNGANIAANLLLTEPEVLQGALLFRAMLPAIPEKSPKLADTPVLLLSGEFDSMMPKESVEKLYKLLTESGAKTEFIWQPTGHGLIDADIEAAKRWLSEL